MKYFFSSWFVSSIALAFVALILGSHMNIGEADETTVNRVLALAIVGLLFTLVFEFLGPTIKLLSLPFIIVTFGFFLVIVNALLLILVEWLTGLFGVHFEITNFWWAILASIVISIAQSIVSAVVGTAPITE